MAITVFAGRDSRGEPWPPDYSHEALACIDVIKRLWLAFGGGPNLLAVVANLHHPSADLVLITERGIGVVELKHHFGRITAGHDGNWYAGPKQIKGGHGGHAYQNPHQQVQSYAKSIRDRLVRPIQPPPWLPGRAADWEKLKLQTAVCFTHPDADTRDLKLHYRPRLNPWETFAILRPSAVPGWVASLRFELRASQADRFEPYRLDPEHINRIARQLLGGVQWREIADLMPTGEPYAYLTLIEQDRRMQVFGIDRETVVIGRDANKCSVPIPQAYSLVSRVHAQLQQTYRGVVIEDLNSANGTFVDGTRIFRDCALENGQQITLGGAKPSVKVCALEFCLGTESPAHYASTER